MRGESKKNHSFLMQGMILAGAGIITRLIGIAYRIPVNNILGDEGQGFYGYAFSIYNIALLLTSYSLPLAVSKLVSARMAKEESKNAQRILKGALAFAILVGALVSVLVFVFADTIAGKSLPLSVYALRVLAPGLFIVAIMGVLRGYFQGMGTMVPTAISQILEQIVNAVVSIIGASYLLEMGKKIKDVNPSLPYAYGAAGGTLGTVSGALIGLIFLVILMKRYYPTMQKMVFEDKTETAERYKDIYKILLLTIAPVLLSTAIYNVSDILDQSIFSNIMAHQGYKEKEIAAFLGMFTGKYNTLINIPLAIANALGASLIPSLTATITKGTMKEVREKISMVIRVVMLIAIPSCVAFFVIPDRILSLLYRGNITIPANMLRIGAISVVFFCLSTVTNSILQGLNKMTTPVIHGAISLGIHLVVVVFLLIVPKWGIYSLVVGNLVFSLSMCLLNALAMKRATQYHQELKKTYVLPVAASLVMGVVIAIAAYGFSLVMPDKLATILTIPIALVVYVMALIQCKALSGSEIKAFPAGTKIFAVLKRLHMINEE